jgi:hypothetical protein
MVIKNTMEAKLLKDCHMKCTPQTKPFPHTEYETKRPKSTIYNLWDDLINFLANKYLDPNEWGWVFRGLTKYSYELKSTLDRRLERRSKGRAHLGRRGPYIGRQTAENYLLHQFKRAAHHFVGSSLLPDIRDNRLEWLALMRHYGAPTRLLDFTRSPYVACFFALEETDIDKGKKCAIWAIHTDWLIKASLPRIPQQIAGQAGLKLSDLLDSEVIAKHFDSLFVNNSVPMILPIEPPRSNARLLVQQGLFLCPAALDRSFDKNLSSYKDDKVNMQEYVHKIKIEGRIFAEAMSELSYMNISRASLFPDLEGFGTSLAHKLEDKSSDEIEKLR